MASAKNVDVLLDVRSESFAVWVAQVVGYLHEKFPDSAYLFTTSSEQRNAEIERKLPGNEEANVAARAAAQAVLRSHDEAAKAHVLQFLGPTLKLQLVSRQTGTEIWQELKQQHAEWMLTMGPQWMRDFHQLQPRGNQTVADFCNDADLCENYGVVSASWKETRRSCVHK